MGMSLTLAVASLLAVLVALWPFGPYQLTLILAQGLRRFPLLPAVASANTTAAMETFAICLCVYNEQAVIRDKIADLLRLRASAGGKLQILVYVDCSNDGTTEILSA